MLFWVDPVVACLDVWKGVKIATNFYEDLI